MVGAGAVARLHAEPEFLAAREAARKDIAKAREDGQVPTRDCALEASVLAPSP